jgi:uncharacterized protein
VGGGSGLVIRRSDIEGRGCFSTRRFGKGSKVAELLGERISRREAESRIAHKRRIRICDVDDRTAIDADVGGDATAFINHSCDPNLFMRVVRGHVLFFARREIRVGDELTLDYEMSPHPDTKPCRCGSSSCRGTINRRSEKRLRGSRRVKRRAAVRRSPGAGMQRSPRRHHAGARRR